MRSNIEIVDRLLGHWIRISDSTTDTVETCLVKSYASSDLKYTRFQYEVYLLNKNEDNYIVITLEQLRYLFKYKNYTELSSSGNQIVYEII